MSGIHRPFLVGLSLLSVAVAVAAPRPGAGQPLLVSVQELRQEAFIELDLERLQGARAGDTWEVRLPRVGRQQMTLETVVIGPDGRKSWHARLGDAAGDRLYLKQTREGLHGGVRVGAQFFVVVQRGENRLASLPADAEAAASTQAFALGESVEPGVHVIAPNLVALADAPVGTEWVLPLPDGRTEVVVITASGIDEHGFQQISTISRLDGVGQSSQWTVGPDAVFGTLHTTDGEYQVLTRQGRTEILNPRAAGLSGPQGPDHVEAPDNAGVGGDSAMALAVAAAGGSISSDSSASERASPLTAGMIDTQINLLITYGPSLVKLWGTESAARTRLVNLVEVANQAYGNSGTGVRFRIVGWRQVKVADATPQVQLAALRLDAGGFRGSAAQRVKQGAAMSVFVAPFNSITSSTGTCGLAYVPAARSAGLTAYKQQAPSLMFSAINDGQTGRYYCESLTLAHELGHNLGASHDKANASFAGVFAYSYGKGVSGSFGTVMSYIQPKVALFSSPQLTCTSAQAACGSSTENVVATVLQTKATVAALGKATAAAVAADGTVQAAGWLLQPNGRPYTAGGVTLVPETSNVSCTVGRTGLYSCGVPEGVASVTVTARAKGRTVTPAITTFLVDRSANTPVNATRFYVR